MDEQKIIFSNRFEKEKFEDYKTDLGTGNTITPDFTEADDFLKFIQKNRRSVPSKERIADKDKFIKTVYELSNSFEIDADLIEFAEGYILHECPCLHFHHARLAEVRDTSVGCILFCS